MHLYVEPMSSTNLSSNDQTSRYKIREQRDNQRLAMRSKRRGKREIVKSFETASVDEISANSAATTAPKFHLHFINWQLFDVSSSTEFLRLPDTRDSSFAFYFFREARCIDFQQVGSDERLFEKKRKGKEKVGSLSRKISTVFSIADDIRSDQVHCRRRACHAIAGTRVPFLY